MQDEPAELLIVGRVGRAHGLHGDVVVQPITDAPGVVFAPGRKLVVATPDGAPDPRAQPLHVVRAQPFQKGLLVHFEEIQDRDQAEAWRGRFLLIPAGEAEPLGPDEIYVHELVSMRVVLPNGQPVGVVRGYYELPQGLTLEVERDAGSVLVPYKRIVTRVDRAERVIHIDPPAGLLD